MQQTKKGETMNNEPISLKKKRIFRKNDIWLCHWCNRIIKIRIKEICKGMIRFGDEWESGEEFNRRAIERWGRRIYMFGFIPINKKG
jgi:hypothetical protein